jgi:uncharacterized protein YbjT (DUF2867 family)
MRILVTGASGFVGSSLIPRLLADGHLVRALGRDPAGVAAALELQPPESIPELEIVRADPLAGEGLPRALAGMEVAYYLLHSMERPRPAADPTVRAPSTSVAGRNASVAGRNAPRYSVPSMLATAPFAERERIAAERFAAAAVAAGVRRIVYLGALQPRPDPRAGSRESAEQSRHWDPPISHHLASRRAVERILLDAVPDSVALRASIVIGARSRSFRLLVHLLERLPVLALPAWRRFRTQPIDARDVIEMLVASAEASLPARRLDVSGPDALSYGELITRIAELMLVNRPSLELGVSLTPVAASVAAAITGEDPEFVTALLESLEGDLLPADDRASELLNVPLHTLDAAIEHALSEWEEFEPLAAR